MNLKLDQLLTRIRAMEAQERVEMANVQDVQAKVDELKGKVEAETTVVQSAVVLIQGFAPIIAGLKEQLAAAIAAGADPTALQAVVDGMTAAEATLEANSQALADAVAAGTPAA